MSTVKSYHIYPAFWVTLVYSFGILCGWIFREQIPENPLVILILILFVISVLTHFIYPALFYYFTFPLVFILGVLSLHFQQFTFEADDLRAFKKDNISAFNGHIVEVEERLDGKHRYIMQCDTLFTSDQKQVVDGKIKIYKGRFRKNLHYGDVLKIAGNFEQPPLPANPGEFNLRRYLQLNDIYFQIYLKKDSDLFFYNNKIKNPLMENLILPIRRFIRNTINEHVPSPTSEVIRALILGERQDLDRSLITSFQVSGVIHVLAISGLHVAFILGMLLFFFALLRFPYKTRVIAALLCLFIFVAVVNFKTPVIRASMMAAIYFFAQFFQQRTNAINIVATAALLILAVDPAQLFQPGFQFSFAAVFGIVYGYPKLRELIPFPPTKFAWLRAVKNYAYMPFLVSTCAVFATAPLTWYYYGTLQTGALLINPLIIPLIGLFLILSILFVIMAGIGLPIIKGTALLLHLFFMAIYKMINEFVKLPFVQIQLARPDWILLILFVLIVLLLFNMKRKRNLIYLAVSLFVLLATIYFQIQRADERLRITQVNVGQGDCAIVELPGGKVIVVDGGDKKFTFDAGERYLVHLLGYYNVDRINYLIGTHGHSDHIGGFLSLLDCVQVDTLVLPAYPVRSKLYQQLLTKARRKKVTLVHREKGAMLIPDQKSRIYFYHPDEYYNTDHGQSGHVINNSSLVFKVVHGQASILFTGDLEKNEERDILHYEKLLDSDVLKVGHHGSNTSSGQPFIKKVTPEFALISLAKNNKFKHPNQQVVQRLKNFGAVLRTDQLGAIVLEHDGTDWQVINWRKW